MFLEPLRGDLLPLNEAAHWTRNFDRWLLFVTYTRTTGQTDDKNKRDHLVWIPSVITLVRRPLRALVLEGASPHLLASIVPERLQD